MLATCKSLFVELDNLHKLKESYWNPRTRANEMKVEDKDSKYFHYKANSRQRRNLIKGLTNADGSWKTSKAATKRLIIPTMKFCLLLVLYLV